MNENKLNSKKNKDGYYDFYWGKRNITALWMDFFSTLPVGKENNCEKIFVKRYGKKLNEKDI